MSNSSVFERIVKTDALLLASVPIVANAIYLSAYYPYFKKYDIPLSFFKPDIIETTLTSLTVLFSFYVGFFAVNIIIARFPFFKNMPAFIFVSFWATTITIADMQDRMGLPEVGKEWRNKGELATILFLITLIISFLVTQKQKNKLIVNDTKLSKFLNGIAENALAIKLLFEPAFNEIYKFIGRKGLVFLILASEVCLYSYSIGNSFAQIQSTFMVANTTPECVVLFMNSEYGICYPFDRSAREVSNGFRVLYFKDNQDVIFSTEQLGELSLIKPIPTPQSTPTPMMTETLVPTPEVLSTFTLTPSATATVVP